MSKNSNDKASFYNYKFIIAYIIGLLYTSNRDLTATFIMLL